MVGPQGIPAQALSDTIGAIYDCGLDPEQWRVACRRIAELCQSDAGGMCVHNSQHGQSDQLFEFGYQPEFLDLFEKHYPQSPIAAASIVGEIGDVITLTGVCSDEELFESRFYRELLKPYRYLDFIGFMALRTGSRIVSVHTCRNERAPRYGQVDIGLFELLSPHVCRALAISDALDIRTLRSEMLEATLDGLAAGVYLTRRDGRVVYMNAAAERQSKAGNAIRIVNNRIVSDGRTGAHRHRDGD